MPVLSLNAAAGTFRHRCAVCGHEEDLHLDPAAGHLTVQPECLVVRPCPGCAGRLDPLTFQPTQTFECLRINIPPWEAGEEPHPGSLLGTVTDLGNGLQSVITEHTHGYHLQPERVATCKLHRAMQQHPHLAPHAPLKDWTFAHHALPAAVPGARPDLPPHPALTALDAQGIPSGVTAPAPGGDPTGARARESQTVGRRREKDIAR